MLLAIDIGNTHIHVGVFGESPEPYAHFSVGSDGKRSVDEYALTVRLLLAERDVRPGDISGVILGSVVPTLTEIVRSAIALLTDAPVTVVGPGVKTGFSIRLSDPSALGADLASNTAGAIAAVGYPAIVIDFGTATVVSAVDKERSFPGASILPGIRMSFDALGETGLLKAVSGGVSVPTVGNGTEEAIRSGVLRGQALAVTGLAEQYRRALSLPENVPVVVSGGCAEEILPLLPKSYVHVPLLTLRGLFEIHRINLRRKER